MLRSIITLTAVIAVPVLPLAAQNYTGGLDKVTAILNANPQIPKSEADSIHEASLSLRASGERINEYCSGTPTAAREQRCHFAQGIFFNSVVKLFQRVQDARDGIVRPKLDYGDPRCLIAKRFNDPSAVPEGVECNL